MKMKNVEIVTAINGLNKLCGEEEKADYPFFGIEVAHKINRNSKKLLEAYVPYAEDVEKIQSKEINVEKMQKEINQLADVSTDVAVDEITMSDIEGANLKVNQLATLEFMISDF